MIYPLRFIAGLSFISLCLLFPRDALSLPMEEDRHGWYPIANAKWTYPQVWSTEIGAILGQSEGGEFQEGATGLYLSVEPGGNGIKINAGYGSGILMIIVPASLRAGASYYRVWKDDHGIDEGEQYIGVQAGAALWFITASAGAYYNADSGKGLFSVGIGIGW